MKLLSIIMDLGVLASLFYLHPPGEHLWTLLPVVAGILLIFVVPFMVGTRR